MSVVPNQTLRSVDSLELIVFTLDSDITLAATIRDIYTEQMAWWKRVIIRNLQPADNMTYRTSPDAPLKTLPPLSERTLRGWGSYLEINSAAAAVTGELEIDCVTIQNAHLPQKEAFNKNV